jgi:membrane-bound inhibitor of C-type lysozyme
MTRVDAAVGYSCASSRPIITTFVGDSLAVVSYAGATHRLHRAVSGSGARFTGDSLQWWIKGDSAWLSQGIEPQGAQLERCAVEHKGRH